MVIPLLLALSLTFNRAYWQAWEQEPDMSLMVISIVTSCGNNLPTGQSWDKTLSELPYSWAISDWHGNAL